MSIELQKNLFQFLQDKVFPNQKLSVWLCDTFNIDTSSAYRRIRGEKELSLSELDTLCQTLPEVKKYLQHYLQLENGFQGELAFYNDWESLKRYYQSILEKLEQAASQNHHLQYVARDLPFFCFYGDKELMRYKLNVWAKCGGFLMQGSPPDELLELGQSLFKVYQKLNTTEIWYIWGVYNQISQLQYWFEMDYISLKEVELISKGFCRVLDQYESWLEDQQKPGGGKLTIYTSDFCIMNNGGLLDTGPFQVLMNGFQGIHFLNTSSKPAIELFVNHWNSHLELSTSITGANSKTRYLFFKDIKQKLQLGSKIQ